MRKTSNSSLNFVVSMALFTVFALCLTLTLLMGASSFRNVSSSADERYRERTPLLYISQKLRSFDRVGGVMLERIDGTDVLTLSEDEYNIYIYHRDGYIRELLVFEGDTPNLDLGTELFAAKNMDFHNMFIDSLIIVTVNKSSICINLMSEELYEYDEDENDED